MSQSRKPKGAPVDGQFAGKSTPESEPQDSSRRMVRGMKQHPESAARQPASTQHQRPLSLDEKRAASREAELRATVKWQLPKAAVHPSTLPPEPEIRRLLCLGCDAVDLEPYCLAYWPGLDPDTMIRRAEWLARHADWADKPTLLKTAAKAEPPHRAPRTTDSPDSPDTVGVLANYQPPPAAQPSSGPTEGEAAAEWLGRHVPGAPLTVLRAVEEVVDLIQNPLWDARLRIITRSKTKIDTTYRLLERLAGTGKPLSDAQQALRRPCLPDGRPSMALGELIFGCGRAAGQTRRYSGGARVGLQDTWVHRETEPVHPAVALLWERMVAQIAADMVPELPEPYAYIDMNMGVMV